RAGREHLDGRLGGADPPGRRGERLLALRPRARLHPGPLPPRRQRGDGAQGRLREAPPRDRLAAQGLLGGRHPPDDRLVRRQPRQMDRPHRLAQPRRGACRRAMTVLVTGGGGFLGAHLVERLRADDAEPFVARRRDYDLTSAEETARLFADASPELVVHLAAEVGGIGANRANPGRYWYANLAMGLNVLEQSR